MNENNNKNNFSFFRPAKTTIGNHLDRMFDYKTGIRNSSCHVKRNYRYSAGNAEIWMRDLMMAAQDLHL
jgi:hypothetical protein